MTHLWQSQEVYTFDVPPPRTEDIHGKNIYVKLELYIKMHNPKVTNVRFDEKWPLVHMDVDIPKYPDERPYFTSEDTRQLLDSYMTYANMSREELHEWMQSITVKKE